MTNEEILSLFRKCHKEGTDAHSEWMVKAARWHDFYAGEQWKDKDKKYMEKGDRAALTINQTNPIVNAVSGSEITNRYETRYLPETPDDTEWNDMLTQTLRSIRNKTDAESEESAAFRDCVITGLGWVECSFDPFHGSRGKIVVERIPVFEMLWDPWARRANLEDAEWLMRGKWVSEDVFESLWGGEALSEVKLNAPDLPARAAEEIHDQTSADLYLGPSSLHYDPKKKRVPVWDFQVRRLSPRFLVREYSEDGQLLGEHKLSKVEFERFKEGRDPKSYISQRFQAYTYYRAFIGGGVLLEGGESEIQDFTFKSMTGMIWQKKDGQVEHFGLMKQMEDPQSWVNKMMSSIVHILATNPKGAVVAEEGIFKHTEKAKHEWAKPNPLLIARAGALASKRLQVFYGKYPSGLERLMTLCLEFIPQLAGVGPYLTGQVEDLRRTAGAAVSSVQKQGLVTLSVLLDALRRYRKETGMGGLMLKFIENFVDENTMIRITQDGPGVQAGQVVQFDPRWMEVDYEVIVDEAPSSPSAMLEFWNSLMQSGGLGELFEMGVMTPEIVVDVMPNVPTTVRQKMKENLARMQQAAVPPQEGMEQEV